MPDNTVPGCFAAVLAASLLAAILSFTPAALVFAVPVAALHALLLGLPLYRFLSRNRPPGFAASVLAGFLVGAAPASLFLLPHLRAPLDHLGVVFGGAESGPLLWEGLRQWFAYLAIPAVPGACGAVGGAAFWAVVRKGGQA